MKKMKEVVRKVPPLFYFLRFAHRKCQFFLYFKNLLIDPGTIRGEYYKKIKSTQIDKKSTLFVDRQKEIKEFFKLNNKDLLKYYLKYGFPITYKFKENLINFFEENTSEDEKLKKAYEKAALHYAIRLMLAYERYSMITPYLDYITKGLPINQMNVLDYGCGISDIGLLFASLGAKVTIAELDDKRLDFTTWRFTKRNLHPEVIRIADTSKYPTLEESKYDLIIATEVFEHVRDPFDLLKKFTIGIRPGGFLFDSMGGIFHRDEGGDHLEEAAEIGQSREYQGYYSTHYAQVFPAKHLTYLFKKTK